MNKINYSVVARPTSAAMLAVYIRCRQFTKYVDINTNVHIFRDEWDNESGRIVGNPNAKALNILIRKTLYQLEEIELGYNGRFSLTKLKSIWRGGIATHDFYKIMAAKIEERNISESTRGIHRRVLHHLKQYRPSCAIAELTEDYVRGFVDYMTAQHFAATTQRTMLHSLNCYYNIVKKLFGDKVPDGSFSSFHESYDQRKEYHLQPLTDEDVRLLENYAVREDIRERDRLMLHRFLFMAYTGLRISDFISLSADNFTREGNYTWLSYTSVKTKTRVRLPLSNIFDGRAEQIFNRYRLALTDFFSTNRDNLNYAIARVCRAAGVTKHVSAHVARHTFATRLVGRDVPITTIQKIIGHRSLRTTMVYAKTNDATLIRQLS